MRVFLDANALFSASTAGSATRRLLEALFRRAEVVTNVHAWEEARRNLQQKRPNQLPGLREIEPRLRFVSAYTPVPGTGLPAKDQPVLGGAIGGQCTHLWTSDERHFGTLYGQKIQGVRVVSSLKLAEELIGQGWKP